MEIWREKIYLNLNQNKPEPLDLARNAITRSSFNHPKRGASINSHHAQSASQCTQGMVKATQANGSHTQALMWTPLH